MSHPFYHLGRFFYRSGCSHPFFQGLYRTDSFWQHLLVKTLINTTTYSLLFYKTLRKVYLFNHSSCSHPSLEVVVHLFLSLKWWQSSILWSVLCGFHSLYHCCRSLPLIAIRCHSLLLVVTLYHLLYHSLSFVFTRFHSLSFAVTRCTTRCHLLSLVVTWCTTRLSFYKRSIQSMRSNLYFP